MRSLMGLTVMVLSAGLSRCADGTDDRVAEWRFDGDLADTSGGGHHAVAENPAFKPGLEGLGLHLPDRVLRVDSTPKLNLFPGFEVSCKVYFDTLPNDYINILRKDGEYQLRVDHPREGGRISFFVHLNGWEPRVRSRAVEAGKWYDIVARWDGKKLFLAVNGSVHTARRPGSAIPTDNPVEIGGVPGLLDELAIRNPRLLDREWALAAVGRQNDDARRSQASFGAGKGWSGWAGIRGGQAAVRGGRLVFRPGSSRGILANSGMDVDLSGNPYICIDVEGAVGESADVLFLTERGYGVVNLPLWGDHRTSVATMLDHPFWRGRLELLALSFTGPADGVIRLERLRISSRALVKPFVYIREIAPGRAILRAGRQESIAAVLRNPEGTAERVGLRLSVPAGVELLEAPEKQLGTLARDATVLETWAIRAPAPGTYTLRVSAMAEGARPTTRSLEIAVRAPAGRPAGSYVPKPEPAESDRTVLMHYCPLWKFGTHYGWNKIELWPGRKPAIGFYDEGTPEVADWHIKYALEHGIQGFIYCWYRATLEPEIEEQLGHALHDGLLEAKYLDMFKFSIMWENGCAQGVKDTRDLLDNVLPYWMEQFFTHPSYLKVDNKPVLFVWRPERVGPQLGGVEATRNAFEQMREACRRQGFDGIWIIGCVSTADRGVLTRMAEEGWDASSAYAVWGERDRELGRDEEGLATIPHRVFMDSQQAVWEGKRKIGVLPDITTVMMGWDKRPWFGKRSTFYTRDVSVANFERALEAGKAHADQAPGNGLDRRLFVLDNWNEFGEGHYLEPCSAFGFGFVDAVRRVFCRDRTPCRDVTPEDVGLEMPDRIYRQYREILFAEGVRINRRVTDNLIAWWRFAEDDEHVALDSSGCGFRALKLGFVPAPGVRDGAFRCRDGGTVVLDADPLFFPVSGVTVDLWVKTDVGKQTDHWFVNTVGRPDSGYRLGLSQGRLVWQIPQSAWSHGLVAEQPLPLGRWVHVAGTYDTHTMRLYVDGVECGTLAREGAIRPAERDVVLGSFARNMPGAAFEGAIDEVRIWDRALGPEEIRRYTEALARRP